VKRTGPGRDDLVLASTGLPLSRLENVANQKFFRAPVCFDFLATGRENGDQTEVIDYGSYIPSSYAAIPVRARAQRCASHLQLFCTLHLVRSRTLPFRDGV
jgi:hypothetical protein